MVLAAYAPVVQRLRDAECGVVIVSTSSAAYAARFVSRLGFASPGTMVHDPKRATHRALGLRSSVYASLVMPFRRHLKTFGTRAVREALRVSLVNATAGHGSSWQQGGTFVLHHAEAHKGEVRCGWAWREEYPGDWRPVEQVLAEGLGIEGVPPISYQERLAFVIRVRTERGGGEVEAEAEAEACTRQGCSPEGLAEQLGRQDRQGQAAS